MSIVDTVKRAPKWAWITAGGVTIGAIAVRMYQGKQAAAEVAPVEGADAVGGGATGGASPGYTQPGVIVPPVIMGPSGDQGSAVAGMSVWADAVGSIVDTLGGSFSQLVGSQADTNSRLIGSNTDVVLGALALAGNPPGMATQNPSPVVVTQPAPAPSPVQVAPRKIVRTCGTSYNKNGECWHYSTYYYSDGTSQKVNDHKMHGGKCGDVGTRC